MNCRGCPASAGKGEQRSAVKLTEGTGEKTRKHYTAEEKVAVLRRHLVDKEAVSKLCDELALQPTVFLPLAEGVLLKTVALRSRTRTPALASPPQSSVRSAITVMSSICS